MWVQMRTKLTLIWFKVRGVKLGAHTVRIYLWYIHPSRAYCVAFTGFVLCVTSGNMWRTLEIFSSGLHALAPPSRCGCGYYLPFAASVYVSGAWGVDCDLTTNGAVCSDLAARADPCARPHAGTIQLRMHATASFRFIISQSHCKNVAANRPAAFNLYVTLACVTGATQAERARNWIIRASMTRRMGQIVKIEPNTFEISLFVEEIYINDTPLPHKNKGVHNSIVFNKNG